MTEKTDFAARLAEAGGELYNALQGGYEKCPLCKAPGLIHKIGCPVDDYMRACRLGPFRESNG